MSDELQADVSAAVIAMCQVVQEHIQLPPHVGFLVTGFVVTNEGHSYIENGGNAPLAVLVPVLEHQLSVLKERLAKEQESERKKLD